MRVFVDELPKSCGCCPCCNNEYGLCQIDNNIQLDDYKHFCVVAKNRHEDCPLQSLAEHDKQVRKRACEEIMKEFEPSPDSTVIQGTPTTEAELVNRGFKACKNRVYKILDRIERGEYE